MAKGFVKFDWPRGISMPAAFLWLAPFISFSGFAVSGFYVSRFYGFAVSGFMFLGLKFKGLIVQCSSILRKEKTTLTTMDNIPTQAEKVVFVFLAG